MTPTKSCTVLKCTLLKAVNTPTFVLMIRETLMKLHWIHSTKETICSNADDATLHGEQPWPMATIDVETLLAHTSIFQPVIVNQGMLKQWKPCLIMPMGLTMIPPSQSFVVASTTMMPTKKQLSVIKWWTALRTLMINQCFGNCGTPRTTSFYTS